MHQTIKALTILKKLTEVVNKQYFNCLKLYCKPHVCFNKESPIVPTTKGSQLIHHWPPRFWNVGSREKIYPTILFLISARGSPCNDHADSRCQGISHDAFHVHLLRSKYPWGRISFPDHVTVNSMNHKSQKFLYWKKGKVFKRALLENVQKYSSTPKIFSEKKWNFTFSCVFLFFFFEVLNLCLDGFKFFK